MKLEVSSRAFNICFYGELLTSLELSNRICSLVLFSATTWRLSQIPLYKLDISNWGARRWLDKGKELNQNWRTTWSTWRYWSMTTVRATSTLNQKHLWNFRYWCLYSQRGIDVPHNQNISLLFWYIWVLKNTQSVHHDFVYELVKLKEMSAR